MRTPGPSTNGRRPRTIRKRPWWPGVDLLDPDRTPYVAHGTTVATNALLERRGARTAFIATAVSRTCWRSAAAIGAIYTHLSPRPRPRLVPARSLLRGRRARRCRTGRRARLLSVAERSTRCAERHRLGGRVGRGVPAVLVSRAGARAGRRRGAREAVGRAAPCLAVVDVLPEFREYERASTTAVNAYVAPIVGLPAPPQDAVAPRR